VTRRSPSSEAFRGGRAAKVRAELLRQLPMHCPLCGLLIVGADDAEVDHITPISLGGAPYARNNVRLICKACNRRRGNGDTNGNGTMVRPATRAVARVGDLKWSICWFATDACGTPACRCRGYCWPHCPDPDCDGRGCSRRHEAAA
jgi:5-methylcytosine-specific restriction endonuclease McrA